MLSGACANEQGGAESDAAADAAAEQPANIDGSSGDGTSPSEASSVDVNYVDVGTLPSDASPPMDSGSPGCPLIPGRIFVASNAVLPPNGSAACPYKTITEALAAAGSVNPTTISVGAGIYNSAQGESFPLMVPSNVSIVGGTLELIDGSGLTASGVRTAIQLAGTLSGLTIGMAGSSVNQANVYIAGTGAAGARIEKSIVQGGMNGVWVHGVVGQATTVTISATDINAARKDGVLVDFAAGGIAPSVSITTGFLHANGSDGVDVVAGNVTVGPGVCASTSFPTFIYCNERYGVEGPISGKVIARGNRWNHDMPSSGATPADVNGTAMVDDSCPHPAAPLACP
jgi:hypothetical protein